MKTKEKAIIQKLSEKNPFQIEEGIVMGGPRSVPEELKTFLKESLLNLPVDKEKSIFVPVNKIGKKNTVFYLVQQIKNEIRSQYPVMKNCEYACKTSLDMERRYLGTRVYRIN